MPQPMHVLCLYNNQKDVCSMQLINGSDEIWGWEGVGQAEVPGVIPEMKMAQ